MKKLHKKTIIITGGSLGIGLEVAKTCAREGAQVIIVARNENNLSAAVNELKQIFEINHQSYALDVSNLDEVQKFKQWCIDKKFKINGLVNCAGVYGPIGKTTNVDMQKFTQAIKINFLGTVYMCNAIAPLLQSSSRKKIVNYSGGGAASPFPNYSAYATSKVAITRFTENLSLELTDENIDVNCIAPGFVVTRLHKQTLEKGSQTAGESFFKKTKEQIESGGTSPEIAANLTAFLLSEHSDGITGKFISAPWDQWQDEKFQKRLRTEKDICSLRRIDEKYFFQTKQKTKVAIIGCGLIGKKRAIALSNTDELVACCDTNSEIAEKFSKEFSCKAYTNTNDLFNKVECDIVVIAVVNKYATEIAIQALDLGKHVLIEKPLGRNSKEAQTVVDSQIKNEKKYNKKLIVKVGFNHRFHPHIWKAKQLLDDNKIGAPIIIRTHYGHGGRPGMENEWRASKEFCGGGELLDQGVHIIDLSRWFAGEMKTVYGKAKTKFWDMKVEDNAFAHMVSENDVDIQFHVSWTNWKNSFSFEVFGTHGYLKVKGLGGHYGPETLEFGTRKKEGGKPIIETFSFSEKDVSWEHEWSEFKNAIKENRNPIGNSIDGLNANKIIDEIYNSQDNLNFIENKNEKSISR
jgi:predicted dehydrogenase/NAD(P)-dependent dehydrogenase (short-subunit alcohol dehydrogenase family)